MGRGGPQLSIHYFTDLTNVYSASDLCKTPCSALCISHLLEAFLLALGISQDVNFHKWKVESTPAEVNSAVLVIGSL